MDIMTALFDQDYVTRMYGVDQKREGKRETALKMLIVPARVINSIVRPLPRPLCGHPLSILARGDTVIIFGQHNKKGFDIDVIVEMTDLTAKEIMELKNQESDK